MLDRKMTEHHLDEVRGNLELLALLPDIQGNMFAYAAVDKSLTLIAELLSKLKGQDIATFKQNIWN